MRNDLRNWSNDTYLLDEILMKLDSWKVDTEADETDYEHVVRLNDYFKGDL